MDSTNNILYAGGAFTNGVKYCYTSDTNFIWHDLDVGLNGWVLTIALDQYLNIYVGGNFTSTNAALTLNNIAYWNGKWNPLTYNGAIGLTNGFAGRDSLCETIAVDPNNGNVYVGGYFYNAGSIAVVNIALWVKTSP